VKEKTSKQRIPPVRRKREKIAKDLSEDCRCKCSVLYLISGPAEIKKGKTKTYAIDPTIHRNTGCKAATSECKHDDTTWTVGGTRRGNITLKDEKKKSVKVKVDGTAKAGTFTLKAQANVKCTCKGRKERDVTCDSKPDTNRRAGSWPTGAAARGRGLAQSDRNHSIGSCSKGRCASVTERLPPLENGWIGYGW
jgi:hypothetical protein